MKIPLLDLWLRIRASYWFVPTLMVLAAIAASAALVAIEPAARERFGPGLAWLFAGEPQGMQSLLATIAGSMITVAGVTFSMTLLAVSHATAQLGPGLLAGFMRDRGNQITLGAFVATFVYCLLVLRTVSDTDGSSAAVIPHLATTGAVALAFVSVGVLIYFFHHVPQSINVVRLISNVGDDLVQSIVNMYPATVGEPATGERPVEGPEAVEGTTVCAATQGYLRVIDGDGLIRHAQAHDLVIRLLARPGQYMLPGQPFLRTDSASLEPDTENALLECFSLGFDRTVEQDVLLPAEQLLEIAGKALSPGINNQQTAMLCIDQLFRGLAEILQRRRPVRLRADDHDRVRVIADSVAHEEFLRAVCAPMRQYVAGDWIATRYLLRRLDSLLEFELAEEHRKVLASEREALIDEARDTDMPAGLRESIASCARPAAGT